MQIIETVILGLIQGLTEFIPVSSSGHLVIGQHLFEGSSDHLFLGWINIGTLLALLLYFRVRLIGIIKDIVLQKKYRLGRNIIATTIPAGVIGFIAADFITSAPFFSSITTVLCTLVIVGSIMILLDRLPRAKEIASGEELTTAKAFFIGILQVFALIPVVSRSGSTIIGSRLMGLPPAAAAEYSFLASIPIMTGVVVKLATDSASRDYFMVHLGPLAVGNLVAFASGLLAVGFLMRYLSGHSLALFGWYRIGLAAIVGLIFLVQ